MRVSILESEVTTEMENAEEQRRNQTCRPKREKSFTKLNKEDTKESRFISRDVVLFL
jgi:hypothetical protein